MTFFNDRPIVCRAGRWILPVLALTLAGSGTATRSELQAAQMGLSAPSGIVVVLGLLDADQPELVTELAPGKKLLIYFQSAQSDEVAAVRRVAEAAGLLGTRIVAVHGDCRAPLMKRVQ
jgi:hypothetical protein